MGCACMQASRGGALTRCYALQPHSLSYLRSVRVITASFETGVVWFSASVALPTHSAKGMHKHARLLDCPPNTPATHSAQPQSKTLFCGQIAGARAPLQSTCAGV